MLVANVRSSAFDGWSKWLRANAISLEQVPTIRSIPPRSERTKPTPLSDFVNFSEAIVRETRNVAIPWLVGLNYSMTSLGELGTLIDTSKSVGGALRHFVNYFELLQNFTDISLEVDEQYCHLNYRILDPNIWPRHHDAMFSLGLAAQIIRSGTGKSWDCVDFLFETEQNEMIGNISKVVNAPCAFGAESNTLRFPTAFMDAQLMPQSEKSPMSAINSRLSQRRRHQPLAERVATLVFRDLGQCGLAQDEVARQVGLSGRSMRRKLSIEGTTYQQVIDECRMRQAVFEFRTRPELSISQIALKLGYAEHSTFTRAFSRWSGKPPEAFRRDLASRIN